MTKLYIVTEDKAAPIKVGGDYLTVGSEVELTDEQAKKRLGKVKLKSEIESAKKVSNKGSDTAKLAEQITTLQTSLSEAKKTNMALFEENKRLKAALTK